MTRQSKHPRKRFSKSDTAGHSDKKSSKKFAHNQGLSFILVSRSVQWMIAGFGVVLLCASVYIFVVNRQKTTVSNKSEKSEVTSSTTKETIIKTFPKSYEHFKPDILKEIKIKSIIIDGVSVKVKALRHPYQDSSVHAYVLENFLSSYECDSLINVHNRHVEDLNRKFDPLLCFDSLQTFRQNLNEIGLRKMKVNNKDFIQGTMCINESLSSVLKKHMKWSYSTSFYEGESKFSLTLAERIEKATGLSQKNGGKFQITSYPQNVGYKNHTDCVVGQAEKRDRFATILVYLKDVVQGGETTFPQLGLSVKPKKGMALVWNSMNSNGECDPSSIHNAAQVIKGQKYILQRWYYYHNFPSLGKRIPEPKLPARKLSQPRVSCDEYEFGSCRWYDEWNYDHINEYMKNKHNYI